MNGTLTAGRARNMKRSIETCAHTGKERMNNPPVGLVAPETDHDAGRRDWAHDPYLDPGPVVGRQESLKILELE